MDAWILIALSAAVAATIGAAVGWLYADRRCKAVVNAGETARALAEQKSGALQQELQTAAAAHQVRVSELQQESAKSAADLALGRQQLADSQSRAAGLTAQLEASQQSVLEQRKLVEDSVQKLAALQSEVDATRKQLADSESRGASLAAQLSAGAQNLTAQKQVLDELAQKLTARELETEFVRKQFSDAETRTAALAAQLAASEKNISEQRQLLDDAQKNLTDAFATVSANALSRSGEVFLQMAEARFKNLSTEAEGTLNERKAQIATLLKPLEESLVQYQKRLDTTESQRTSAYGELLKQIGAMSSAEQVLSQQTSQLVSALKKSNVRGRWGEIALQRLVEMAGMTERVDFVQQESLRDDDGRLLRPDLTVRLPGNRSVVVDSKAVMNAFLDALGLTDDAARAVLMQTHARNVRSRVDDLAGKAYWKQFATAPEFVVLFLPGESFLYAACESDPDLIQYAISQSVLLATPTTFIGLLRTIEHGWRQQAVSENAEAIRDLGKQIYERLAILGDNMSKLGKSLDNAVDHYNKSIGTLDTRLLVSARKMSELGAGNGKELPEMTQIEKRARELAAPLHPDKSPLLPE